MGQENVAIVTIVFLERQTKGLETLETNTDTVCLLAWGASTPRVEEAKKEIDQEDKAQAELSRATRTANVTVEGYKNTEFQAFELTRKVSHHQPLKLSAPVRPSSPTSLTITIMPARYAPLPTRRPPEHSEDELDAAFNGSDDELDLDDDNAPISESQPLNPSRSGRTSPPLPARNLPAPIAIPGAYDFERVDYDVPPPGSPTRAMANDYGNTNGFVPSFDTDVDLVGHGNRGARSWLSRTAANVLPSHYVRRFGFGGPSAPTAHVGGGGRNDGVFSNLAAKPERRRQQQTGA